MLRRRKTPNLEEIELEMNLSRVQGNQRLMEQMREQQLSEWQQSKPKEKKRPTIFKRRH